MMAFFYAQAMSEPHKRRANYFLAILNPVSDVFLASTNHMMAFFYAHITCSLGSPRGGGGFKPYCLRLSLRTECYRNILCGSGHNDGVFLCTLNFYLAAQGGGGGLNPPKPPRRSATGVISRKGHLQTCDIFVT